MHGVNNKGIAKIYISIYSYNIRHTEIAMLKSHGQMRNGICSIPLITGRLQFASPLFIFCKDGVDKNMDLEKLKAIVEDEKNIITEGIPQEYLADNFGRVSGEADALIFVSSTEEVSRIMKFANENLVPVIPRGAGTNLVGSTTPTRGGIILDFSHMNRILDLDEQTMTVTVEPGILLQDLQAYVEERGLFYPPDPGEKASTIGGNISTNAGGMRAVKYGVTRDYVRSLEVVTASGEILTVGRNTVKDASGLSLKNLFIGSEGTLVVITKCVLKLIPKPEKSLSVIVPYPSLAEGINSVIKILRANANPTAVEFTERKVVKLAEDFLGIYYPCPEADSYILLTFDGHADEVEANAERIRKIALDTGALDYILLTDPAYANDIWKVRGALVNAIEAVSQQEPSDITVPVNKIAEFIQYVNAVEEESGMRMIAFGHAGDGNVHVCVARGNRNEEEWQRDLNSNMDKLYAKAYELGGVTSGEHGIGLSKRSYYLHETAKENLLLMNQIKDALDPKHILNDNKSYITGEDTI